MSMIKLFKKNNNNDGTAGSYPTVTESSSSVTESSVQHPNNYYKIDNKNIGVALIFNTLNFKNRPDKKRVGSEKDMDSIKNTLQNYGFNVKPHTDKTKDEISDILHKESMRNHKENDCLVVVVMTHSYNKFLADSDFKFYPVDKLWKPFLNINCPSLNNKPKLFFIQACRDKGFEEPSQFKDGNCVSNMKLEENTYSIPNSADILIMYSSKEDFASSLDSEDGSWFIQSLSVILDEKLSSNGIDLNNLLTLVNHRVANEYERADKTKQMPYFVSSLTKLFSIKPKPKNQNN